MMDAVTTLGSGDARPVRAALLRKLCGGDGLFALGVSIARVVELASSDVQGTQSLAYHVLSDVALTQKILLLANTPIYRTSNATPVTTISRAISVLGFDSVKMAALAMLLVDTLSNSKHAHSVRIELEAALCASLIGREMGRLSAYQGAEDASISALFKNIGPLLIASQEHARFREIDALIAGGKHSQNQASQMILGSSFDALSVAVLHEWKIPDLIVRSLSPLPPGLQKVAINRQEWVRQVATFSSDGARLLVRNVDLSDSEEARALQKRFGVALNVDLDQIARICATVREEVTYLLQSMNMPPQPADDGDGLSNVLLLASMDGGARTQETVGGKPANAYQLLLAGVQQVTQMRVAGQSKVNDLILAVLETLYRSMGFRFATVCLKDAKRGQYRARLAFGEKQAERQAGFVFPLIPAHPDLFYLAMQNDADLIIPDASAPRVHALLPAWHRALLPDARSFIVLPLVLQSVQLGLFYADRTDPAPEGVAPDEGELIRALKGQVLVALTP